MQLKRNQADTNLPYEIIVHILDLIQKTNVSEDSGFYDILSCSMLSRSWNKCAMPYITKTLTDLDLHFRSISDLRRIASILQESKQYHSAVGLQITSMTIYLDCMFEESKVMQQLNAVAKADDKPTDDKLSGDEPSDDKPSDDKSLDDKPALEQCSGENHQLFTFRQDIADVLVDIVTNAFVLNDLTLHFGGMTCQKCLLNTGSFFTRIRPINKTLRRLSLHEFGIKTTECKTTEEKQAGAYEPLADFLVDQLDLEEIRFHQFNGDDLIVHALGRCANIHTFHLNLVDHFDSHLISTDALPAWPKLRSFRISAAKVHLDSIIECFKTHCPLLEDLSLPADTHEDEELVVSLYQLLRMRSAQLVQVSIPDLAIADDTFLIFLCDNLPNIRHLSISGGKLFKGSGVKEVQWDELQYLDITGCYRMQPAFVLAVLDHCNKLTEFRLSVTTWREEVVLDRLCAAGFTRTEEWNHGAVWIRKMPVVPDLPKVVLK
ncbi:hypothetical protein BC938DRAFT_474499 [Jimgerdemannia flammicorona]|uniref:F-box domain-containing protein n=1 Tax=Jimgerdemannia flammicorona TaxID=994334 RepID=A0A433Q2G6_9FUNG|nr:hypothetical protein BC938DRAFT_474499 [Jimgerdemannia flammicorona]